MTSRVRTGPRSSTWWPTMADEPELSLSDRVLGNARFRMMLLPPSVLRSSIAENRADPPEDPAERAWQRATDDVVEILLKGGDPGPYLQALEAQVSHAEDEAVGELVDEAEQWLEDQ